MILNYTYRLYPDAQQIELLDEWLETCRISYNYALRELKDWIASRKCPVDRCSLESEYIMSADYPFPGYGQQQNNLPEARKNCNRGIETYRGNSEKQEIGSQVVLSGNLILDKWRNIPQGIRGAKSVSDNVMPAL